MNRQHVRLGLAGLAVVGSALALTGCTINIGIPGMAGNDSRMMGGQSNGEFSATDLMFATMMIPHHQQAVDMSALALEHSTNPEVRALAEQISAAQQPEIQQMQAWLDGAGDAGMTSSMSGHMHDMGGMLSDDQMAALRTATGVEFDRLFLQGMIAHHEGAIAMASMITSSGNAEAKALGEAIVSSQTAEIETMKALLASLN